MTDAGDGWQDFEAKLGFYNGTESTQFLYFPSFDEGVTVQVDEEHSYPLEFHGWEQFTYKYETYVGLWNAKFPLASGLAICSGLLTVRGQIPIESNPESLSFPGYPEVDLTQSTTAQLCEPKTQMMNSLDAGMIIGTGNDRTYGRLSIHFDEATESTQVFQVGFENLNMFDGRSSRQHLFLRNRCRRTLVRQPLLEIRGYRLREPIPEDHPCYSEVYDRDLVVGPGQVSEDFPICFGWEDHPTLVAIYAVDLGSGNSAIGRIDALGKMPTSVTTEETSEITEGQSNSSTRSARLW